MIFKFNLKKPPMFYVCGYLDISEPWMHKAMFQKGNFEVILVLQGKIYLDIEGEQHVINRFEYFIVPPYKHMQGFKESPIGTKMIWIHFFPQSDDSHKIDNYYLVAIPQHAAMFHPNHLIILAHQILDQAEFNNNLVTDFSVAELLSFMSTDYTEHQKHGKKFSAVTEVIKNWIDANIGNISTVSDISNNFNFNDIYLNRIFKKEYKISIYQYLISSKIKYAKYLLLSTDKTIYEISQESYFNDEKNFSKTFKKRAGITPSKYRKTFNRRFINTPMIDPEIPIPDRIKNRINE